MAGPDSRRFRLEEVLDAGPDSTIWRARCTRPTERTVAVKHLRAGPGDELERTLAELRTLVRIEHPNLVRTLEVLDGSDGVTVVMQYAAGGSLADLLAARAHLEPGEVVALAAPIADALDAAHRAGVVHGDVTPSNIVLTSTGEPLLTDFDRESGGTDGYVAPEVRAGSRADARSDVFALASVCRDALGGDVPTALAPVLDAATASDPQERVASCGELALLLRAAVAEDAVRLPGPAPAHVRACTPRTRQFGPRPPARVAPRRRTRPLVVAAVMVGFLCVGVAWRVARPTTQPPPSCPGPAVPVPPGAEVVAGDTSGAGCLSVGVYADQVLTIRVRLDDPQPRRFALGRPGDVLRLGDWDCDGLDTPALERPSSRTVLYYDTWNDTERPVTEAPCRSVR